MQVFSLNRRYLVIGLITICLSFGVGLILRLNGVHPAISNGQKVVVIDAGHGSVDSGATYGDLKEKDINLAVAFLLKEQLEQSNVKVIMTRTEDVLHNHSRREDLLYRVRKCNEVSPDAFISIHVNKFPTAEPFGGQAYYHSGERSKLLAEKVQEQLKQIQPDNYRTIGTGDYLVLKHTKCPAIIVEIGFISHHVDRQRLTDKNEQYRIAKAVKNGVLAYLNQGATSGGSVGTDTGTNTGVGIQTSSNPDSNQHASGAVGAVVPTNSQKITNLSQGYDLYFAQSRPAGETLVPVHQPLPAQQIISVHSNTHMTYLEKVAYEAMKGLIAGPKSASLAPVIPTETRLLSLKIKNGLATVNFNNALIDNHWGGAESEELTVRSIVQTLTAFTGIDQVQILIEGNTVQTIAGHVSIEEPLTVESVR